MNEFMKLLLSLTCSGTLLILIILTIRFALKKVFLHKSLSHKRFSMRWQYYIWLIAVLRFVLPFTLDNTIVGRLFQIFDTGTINKFSGFPDNPVTVSAFPADTLVVPSERQVQTVCQDNVISVEFCLFVIWSVLMLVLFVRKITIYQGYICYIKAGSTEISDISVLNLLSDCQEKLGIKQIVEVYQNPLIASPVMIGFFCPQIILPSRTIPLNKLSHIFNHELTHYKRKDMFYKWFVQIVLCIHWFNPFVYLLAKEINKACELSCDEGVVELLDNKGRKEYGDTLLLFLKADSGYENSLASVTLTEGAEQLKERLGAIMNPKKKSKVITAVIFFFTIIICICFAVSGAYAAPAAYNVEEPESEMIESEMIEYEIVENGIADQIGEGDKYEDIFYRQEGYYWNSYVIGVAWNWNESMYTRTEGEKALLRSSMYFADSVGSLVNDTKAVTAAEDLIHYLKGMNIFPEIKTPLITKMDYVAVKDVPAMIKYYYEAGDIYGFSALFPLLDKISQKEYMEELYLADNAALFDIASTFMEKNVLSSYTQRAVKDNRIEIFSILLDYMDIDTMKAYTEKFYKADDIAFFSIIMNYMTEEEKQEWLELAQADERADFCAVISGT